MRQLRSSNTPPGPHLTPSAPPPPPRRVVPRWGELSRAPAIRPCQTLSTYLGLVAPLPQVGLATPSTFRACREVAYATLLDLHNAARGAEPAPLDDGGMNRAWCTSSLAKERAVPRNLLPFSVIYE